MSSSGLECRAVLRIYRNYWAAFPSLIWLVLARRRHMRLSLAILKGLPSAFLLLLSCSGNVCAESGDWVQFYRPAQEDIKKSRWVEAEHNLKQAMPLAKELGEDDIRYAFTIGALGR